MTKNRTTALVKSPFLSIKRAGKDFKIVNNITGKKFLVDKQAIDVINKFEAPTLLSECNFNQGVEASIHYLVNNGVLVPSNHKIAALNHRQLVSQTLFSVKEYKEKADEKNIVFLGIPFGAGNPVSSDTKKFPDYLRLFLEKKIYLKPGLLLKMKLHIVCIRIHQAIGRSILSKQLSTIG